MYTQGTDVAFTVAYAAKQSGLPGLDPDIALSTENKIIMREKLLRHLVDLIQHGRLCCRYMYKFVAQVSLLLALALTTYTFLIFFKSLFDLIK